mmetsp:Transcript_26152/g.39944  ORF Transcript_26152/g.39944 Transcript_26152/m.39944 type:complete len:94 (-) Transcript_26152:61-342(-)
MLWSKEEYINSAHTFKQISRKVDLVERKLHEATTTRDKLVINLRGGSFATDAKASFDEDYIGSARYTMQPSDEEQQLMYDISLHEDILESLSD